MSDQLRDESYRRKEDGEIIQELKNKYNFSMNQTRLQQEKLDAAGKEIKKIEDDFEEHRKVLNNKLSGYKKKRKEVDDLFVELADIEERYKTEAKRRRRWRAIS